MRPFEGPTQRASRLRRRVLVHLLGLGTAAGLPPARAAGPDESALPAAPSAASRTPTGSAPAAVGASRWFTTSDGVRLHYLEAGRSTTGQRTPTFVFVPGWTMPAWIWQAQIERFAPRARVLALDPRGQGHSEIASAGYDHARRAADIAELLAAARCRAPVVLVGWSLGVLECLQYMHDARRDGAPSPVRALVLVDNSVGVGDPPAGDPTFFARLRSQRRQTVTGFVNSMFKRPPAPPWRDALVQAALRMPLQASIDLLRQPRPREFWRDALYATTSPVLYAYTPKFAQQGEIVKARLPAIETRLFAEAGHALFVDEAAAFNRMLEDFVGRAVGQGVERASDLAAPAAGGQIGPNAESAADAADAAKGAKGASR